MLIWKTRNYSQLSTDEFHDLIQLRIAVFVIEQDCPYQELDGIDKVAWHVTGETESGEIVAYARIVPQGVSYEDYPSIGRVLVKPSSRGTNIGHEIVRHTIAALEEKFSTDSIKISAQEHLENFYESHGFKRVGEGYLEDNIPHIAMIREPTVKK